MGTIITRLWYVAEFFLEWMLLTYAKKLKSHIFDSINTFRKIVRLWDNVEIW